MGFSWFPFNIKDFMANTMRLNTEAKGAYILLILDYYERGSGPPDDDDILAAICGLPVKTWERHRKVIAPLFAIDGGHWKHDRIDFEIADANRKHASYTARASAGGNAKAKKDRLKSASSTSGAELEHGHLHLHKKDSLSTRANEVLQEGKEEVAQVPSEPLIEDQVPDSGLGTTIPRDFVAPPEFMERALQHADASTVHLEVQKFIFHHREQATWSHDWPATLEKWWARFVEHQRKNAKPRAAPRVEVNTVPAEIDWATHVKNWVADNSRWPRKLCGPEPGQAQCRVPVEVFEALGIDRKTGLKIKETS